MNINNESKYGVHKIIEDHQEFSDEIFPDFPAESELGLQNEVEKIMNEFDSNIDNIKISKKMEETLLRDIEEFKKERFQTKNNIGIIKLSEEDLEALRLGHELLKKKKKEENDLYEIHREYHKHLESTLSNRKKRQKASCKRRAYWIKKLRRIFH